MRAISAVLALCALLASGCAGSGPAPSDPHEKGLEAARPPAPSPANEELAADPEAPAAATPSETSTPFSWSSGVDTCVGLWTDLTGNTCVGASSSSTRKIRLPNDVVSGSFTITWDPASGNKELSVRAAPSKGDALVVQGPPPLKVEFKSLHEGSITFRVSQVHPSPVDVRADEPIDYHAEGFVISKA